MGNNRTPSASPAFKANVKEGFWMSTTEITNEQFRALFPEHDSRYIGQTWKDHTTPGYAANRPKQPVVRVSWDEAMLSAKRSAKYQAIQFLCLPKHNGNGQHAQEAQMISGSDRRRATLVLSKTWQTVRLSIWR